MAAVRRPIQAKSHGLLHAAAALVLANIGAFFAYILAYAYYAEPATLGQFGDDTGSDHMYWKVRPSQWCCMVYQHPCMLQHMRARLASTNSEPGLQQLCRSPHVCYNMSENLAAASSQRCQP